jgi:hypothetical protein
MGELVGPVEVAAFRGLDEAEVARGMLESEGIETHLSNEHLVAANWTLSQATGGVKLVVAAEHASRARQVLSTLEDRAIEDDGAQTPEADLLIERAWKAALIGFVALPPLLHLWAFWLLRRAYALGGPGDARARRLVTRVVIVSGCAIAFYAALYSKLLL